MLLFQIRGLKSLPIFTSYYFLEEQIIDLRFLISFIAMQ